MALSESLKIEIIQVLNDQLKENKTSIDELYKRTGVYPNVLNAITEGKLKTGNTPIPDASFKKIADVLGFRYDNEFWRPIETSQFIDIYSALLDAKVNCRVKMVIGQTGCGKTYTVNRFKQEYPQSTYVVTVHSLFKVRDIVEAFGKALGLHVQKMRFKTLIRSLRKLSM